MTVKSKWKAVVALASFGLAPVAQAHIGAAVSSGLAAGIAHPFTGLDHALAMIAVGLWAAQHAGRARIALPLAFVTMMAIGAVFAVSGVLTYTAIAEFGIVASVFVVGLLIAARAELGMVTSLLLVGGFALFHGHAHGTALPATAAPAAYAVGMMLSTLALHAVGWAVGRYGRHAARPSCLRGLGGGIAALGMLLWIGA